MLFCDIYPDYSSAKSIPVPYLTAALEKEALVERQKFRHSKRSKGSVRIEGDYLQ